MTIKKGIEKGAEIDAYNDGKRSPSRLVLVVVDYVVNREELSKRYLRMWKRAIDKDFKDALLDGHIHYVDGPQQFWDWNCGTFVFGHIKDDKESIKDPMMFAQRPNGTWYGVNWNYMLDA